MALVVIGAGFGRTGTNSLKIALETLGLGPCHHMFEVRDNPAQLPAWEQAAEGAPCDWDSMFAGYRSQVDWPGARYWRELAAHYPDAKVVLSVRDPDAWFDSVQATIIPFLENRGKHGDAHANAIAHMGHRLIGAGLFQDRLSDREHAIGVFKAHVDEVKATIAPGRLLTFDVAEGWEPLCRFLGTPVPETPFPRTNSSKQFKTEEWA